MASLPQATQDVEVLVHDFDLHGWCIIDNAVPAELCKPLHEHMMQLMVRSGQCCLSCSRIRRCLMRLCAGASATHGGWTANWVAMLSVHLRLIRQPRSGTRIGRRPRRRWLVTPMAPDLSELTPERFPRGRPKFCSYVRRWPTILTVRRCLRRAAMRPRTSQPASQPASLEPASRFTQTSRPRPSLPA